MQTRYETCVFIRSYYGMMAISIIIVIIGMITDVISNEGVDRVSHSQDSTLVMSLPYGHVMCAALDCARAAFSELIKFVHSGGHRLSERTVLGEGTRKLEKVHAQPFIRKHSRANKHLEVSARAHMLSWDDHMTTSLSFQRPPSWLL